MHAHKPSATTRLKAQHWNENILLPRKEQGFDTKKARGTLLISLAGAILDYLAVHPFVAKPRPQSPAIVRGAGTALLFFLCSVAQQHGCAHIWGEATQNSCAFYQQVSDLDLVTDLLYIPAEKIAEFVTTLEGKWQQTRQ